MSKKYKGKQLLRSLCILFLICTVIPHYIFSQETSPKHILLISSYFPDKENSKLIINSFSQTLNAKFDCRINVEYMDSESSTDFNSWKKWMKQLFEAYKNPPDIIVIIGGEAWTAYTATCPKSWKNFPVVLGGVKISYIDYAHISPCEIKSVKDLRSTTESFGDFKVTGYYLTDYFRENMELIKRIQPDATRIAFIYDNRYKFNFLTPFLQKIAKETGFENLDSYYGSDLTTMQLVDSLKSQDNKYAILSAGWYTDARHYSHSYAMLHNELSLLNSKYFYLIMDQGEANPTYLGGYYVSAKDIGKDLAGLTYQVLINGIDNSPKFQSTPSAPQYYINYKTLQTSGTDKSLLPPETIFYNKAPSFFKTYFWQSIVALLIFTVVISTLLLRMRSYRQITAVKTKMMEEQKKMREKAEILRQQADESNRLKSTFLANMSHEIRTPLNAIVGFANQLPEAENEEEVKMYRSIIKTNSDLLLQLINDILDLSKIEAGTLDFIYTTTDVVEICRNLEQIYSGKIKEGVSLICVIPDKECLVRTERNRITQVISNFLSNAAKFTDHGSIRFGYEHIEGGLRFFVTDTGKGISTENLPKVFIRFEKFDKFVPGNGLGMSICKSIVEKLNGSIGVESEEGKGSTFWFILPCEIIHRTLK